MKRKILIMTLLISLVIIVSGCWNRRELNELAIVVGLGIDKSDDQYLVTAQVVNPGEIAKKGGGGGKTPVIVYQEKGETIFQAIRKITTVAPRKLYFAHQRMLVFGEELAKEGIGEALDFLSRDPELRTDFYIVVAKDAKAGDVLKILTHLEAIPANKMFTSLETSEKAWAPSVTVTLDKLIADMVSDGINPALTGITIKGDLEMGETMKNLEKTGLNTKLQYQGMALFNNDKLIGWLNDDDSRGLHYSTGTVKSSVGVISCPKGGKIGIEVVRTKADLKAMVKNGEPKGTIKVQVEGNVGDVKCRGLDLKKTETIYNLEKIGEKALKEVIQSSIEVTQKEFQSDVFGFGEALHRSDPAYWKKVKKEWNQKFSEMPVTIEVDVKIRQTGTIGNSPLNEIAE
ncbi:Ger(x)C family spore germination protein [Bacillus sp. DTU_2020_1000418_1_SI_GHA_SEK_038]|uniref:Ger(x)C family spore germination protein n=1 Tax=Bacillus sp. DTU_2020_1000418_1_SI_GHA_SEK_038 TaxID=3077585 RepID=UPI0028EE12F2|nr:Ger(x)C family spore germination protein [Bacillus sp. DTU_2020_1000418_1_SI_GHA_SEK_038]WNS73485.1 Ger(x)C family spore germination protein [Bacillus sp. DTU_2020_1000418_1_SI_GHA_SEK_038]